MRPPGSAERPVVPRVGEAAPHRVRLSRAMGWKMPPNTMKVDRATRWGNPWKIVGPTEFRRLWWVQGPRSDVECNSEADAVALSLRKFRFYAETHPELTAELRGKNLACWCALDAVCHADVLLELANAPDGALRSEAELGPGNTPDQDQRP